MAARPVRRRPFPLLAVVAALTTAAAVAVPTIASAAPGPHTAVSAKTTAKSHPATVASLQKRLAHLAVKNAQLVEQYNQARILVGQRSHAATLAHQVAAKAAASYNTANEAFTQVVQAQYESGGFGGSSGALLTSSNSNSYLDAISTMDLVSSHETQIVRTVQAAHRVAAQAETKAATLLATAETERAALGREKTTVAKQISSYKSQLAMLTAKQQASYNRMVDPSVNPSDLKVTAPSAAAQRAVNFAIAQIGKPYVFGAAGPDTYDCSGLTMMAWRAGGVSLPHSAAEQYDYGTHVSRAQLQPGDLIFFYQPIGHVTIYVGDGMMVSAPETGENVSLVPLDAFNSDYAGATHIG